MPEPAVRRSKTHKAQIKWHRRWIARLHFITIFVFLFFCRCPDTRTMTTLCRLESRVWIQAKGTISTTKKLRVITFLLTSILLQCIQSNDNKVARKRKKKKTLKFLLVTKVELQRNYQLFWVREYSFDARQNIVCASFVTRCSKWFYFWPNWLSVRSCENGYYGEAKTKGTCSMNSQHTSSQQRETIDQKFRIIDCAVAFGEHTRSLWLTPKIH